MAAPTSKPTITRTILFTTIPLPYYKFNSSSNKRLYFS
jgi:hypothetical protein